MHTLTLRFTVRDDNSYALDLASPDVGEAYGEFVPPFNAATARAVTHALEPGFDVARADDAIRDALTSMGVLCDNRLRRLRETVGGQLVGALIASDEIARAFDVALGIAEAQRKPLPIELHFGVGADALAALPWELIHYRRRFLVRDGTIALSRYPEGAIPPTEALGELPLRVLLMLPQPIGERVINPLEKRRALLHGLRRLDEQGAVVVDLLQPPTFETLVEAVTNGAYHVLHFDGHGVFAVRCACGALNAPGREVCGKCEEPLASQAPAGFLQLEDEYGRAMPVEAERLAAALRNTTVRLAVLSACQSAQVAEGDVWSGATPILVRAGVPLAVGMQVSVLVKAATAFARQFYLDLAAGRPVIEAVADGRKALLIEDVAQSWFVPALYGRPRGDTRLFDPGAAGAVDPELRAQMQGLRAELDRLEGEIGAIGVATRPEEIARLRAVREWVRETRAKLARRTPGGYAHVVSPLYGVLSNPYFVGRGAEICTVAESLAQKQHTVVWGTGGIGKTALVVEVAHRQGWRFPGGVLWLDCKGAPPLDSLLNRMGAFCGHPEVERMEPDERRVAVRAALAGLDHCLLVWDNAEDVLGRREVREFLHRLPSRCKALLTTRDDPEVLGWRTVELGGLASEAMTELFFLIAVDAGVKVGGAEDWAAIPQVIDFLEGHPLALTLVVPLAKKRGLRRVWAELQEQPLRGVEAALNASFERLNKTQQTLFTRLSVFTVAFTAEAAHALLPDEGEVDDALDGLVQRALLRFDGTHYDFHALVRQYAYRKLQTTNGQWPTVHRAAAKYLSARLKSVGGTPEEALEMVDQWKQAQEWETFVREASGLVGSLDRLGYWHEIEARLMQAREVTRTRLGDKQLEAQVLLDCGRMAYVQANMPTALESYRQALELFRAVGDRLGEANTLKAIGDVQQFRKEIDAALESYRQALELFRAVGARLGEANTLQAIGDVQQFRDERDAALESYRQALELFRAVGDRLGEANTLKAIGNLHLDQGNGEQGLEMLDQAFNLYQLVGDRVGQANIYWGLGLRLVNNGALQEAEPLLTQAVDLARQFAPDHPVTEHWTAVLTEVRAQLARAEGSEAAQPTGE
jgi:tetratricopeptide (TPR) repeat protein